MVKYFTERGKTLTSYPNDTENMKKDSVHNSVLLRSSGWLVCLSCWRLTTLLRHALTNLTKIQFSSPCPSRGEECKEVKRTPQVSTGIILKQKVQLRYTLTLGSFNPYGFLFYFKSHSKIFSLQRTWAYCGSQHFSWDLIDRSPIRYFL